MLSGEPGYPLNLLLDAQRAKELATQSRFAQRTHGVRLSFIDSKC